MARAEAALALVPPRWTKTPLTRLRSSARSAGAPSDRGRGPARRPRGARGRGRPCPARRPPGGAARRRQVPAGADAGLHVPGDGAADGADSAEAERAPGEGIESPVPGRRAEDRSSASGRPPGGPLRPWMPGAPCLLSDSPAGSLYVARRRPSGRRMRPAAERRGGPPGGWLRQRRGPSQSCTAACFAADSAPAWAAAAFVAGPDLAHLDRDRVDLPVNSLSPSL